MSSVDAPPGVLAATLAVGVGGVTAVQRFMYVKDTLREVADESAISAKNAIEASLPDAAGVDSDYGSDPTEFVDSVEREGGEAG